MSLDVGATRRAHKVSCAYEGNVEVFPEGTDTSVVEPDGEL